MGAQKNNILDPPLYIVPTYVESDQNKYKYRNRLPIYLFISLNVGFMK